MRLKIFLVLALLLTYSFAFNTVMTNVTSSNEADSNMWELNVTGAEVLDGEALFEFDDVNYTVTKTGSAGAYTFRVTRQAPWYYGDGNFPLSQNDQTVTFNTITGAQRFVSNFYVNRGTTINRIAFIVAMEGQDACGGDGCQTTTTAKVFDSELNEIHTQDFSITTGGGPTTPSFYERNVTPGDALTEGMYFFQVTTGSVDNVDVFYNLTTDQNTIRDSLLLENPNPSGSEIEIEASNSTLIYNLVFSDGELYDDPSYTYFWHYNVTTAGGTTEYDTGSNTLAVTPQYYGSDIVTMGFEEFAYFGDETIYTPTLNAPSGTQNAVAGVQDFEYRFNISDTWGRADYVALDGSISDLDVTIPSATARKYAIRKMMPWATFNLTNGFTGHTQHKVYNHINTIINQTFYRFNFCTDPTDNGDYCGACTDESCLVKAINYVYRDENNLSAINASQASTFTISYPTTSIENYSLPEAANHTYYIYPNATESLIVGSSFEQFDATGYTTRFHFYTNANITTDNQTIYLLPDAYSTYVSIYVLGSDGDGLPGVVVVPLRYFPATNSFMAIGMARTGDSGQAQMYMRVDNIYYRFAVYDSSGELLHMTTNMEQILCPGSSCAVTIEISGAAGGGGNDRFIGPYTAASCYGDNVTNRIIYNFIDYAGITQNISFLAYRGNGTSNIVVCNETIEAITGSYECSLTGVENLSAYMYTCAVGMSTSPMFYPYWRILDFRTVTGMNDWLIVVLVFIIGFAAGTLRPAIAVISVPIVLFALRVLGIIGLNEGVVIVFLVVGAALAFLMARD